MPDKLIEITGVGTQNKGAELMLVAIREHFARMESVGLAINIWDNRDDLRLKHGMWLTADFRRPGRSKLAFALMPQSFRNAAGIVPKSRVSAMLNASGFAIGDKRPARMAEALVSTIVRARRAGQSVVLLPQAMGPFEQPRIRRALSELVEAADLIFPRDARSMRYVVEAIGERANVVQAPDVTVLLTPPPTPGVEDVACIVPNVRMISHARDAAEAQSYVQILGAAVDVARSEGLDPVFLIHSEEDRPLVDRILEDTGVQCRVHREEDPLDLKAFIGGSRLVLGSRYHALLSALSQGVPAIGTSWSHKYEALFDEYGVPDLLLTNTDTNELRRAFEFALGEGEDSTLPRLQDRAGRLRHAVRDMWHRVDRLLGLSLAGGTSIQPSN